MKQQPVLGGLPQPMRAQMEDGPMPATSKKQFKLMHAVASGSIEKPGLSVSKAAEFVSGQSPKRLPEKTRYKVKFPSAKRLK